MGKVLLHFAVLMDVAAAIKIAAGRAAVEILPNGLLSPQNLPLAIMVAVVVIVAEFSSRKKISEFHVFLFSLSAAVFFLSSFYLPPVGDSVVEVSVFAYAALLAQFAAAVVIPFFKRPGFVKIFMAFVFIAGISSVAAFAYTYSDEETFQEGVTSDAAVVLGTAIWGKYDPGPLLQTRLDTAIGLFNSDRTRKIVVTGGTRRYDAFESQVSAWYLLQRGIPQSEIIAERGTFCTCEQAEYIKRVLVDSLGMKNIVVITDSWHLPRAMMMCKWEGQEAYGEASRTKLDLKEEIYNRLRESAGIQVFLLFGA